jgi:hypothetical protein
MRKLEIKQAVRKGQKARILLSGPSGSGKTFKMLKIALALAGKDGKVIVIDTEHGSASLYSDKFKFEVIEWAPPFDPRELATAIRDLDGKYQVIGTDSLSHFWMGEGGTLAVVDAAAERSKGNKFAGWKEGTPAQNDLIEAIVRCDAHLIATTRAKTEYVQEKDEKGRTSIRKIGMAPIQRDGLEFEFDIQGEINAEHDLVVTKSRCEAISDKVYKGDKVAEFAKTVKEWLDGAEPIVPQAPVVETLTQPQIGRLIGLAREAGITDGKDTGPFKVFLGKVIGKEVQSSKDVPQSEIAKIETAIKNYKPEQAAQPQEATV